MKGSQVSNARLSFLIIACFFARRSLYADETVKVFILEGHSNMEGKGFLVHLRGRFYSLSSGTDTNT